MIRKHPNNRFEFIPQSINLILLVSNHGKLLQVEEEVVAVPLPAGYAITYEARQNLDDQEPLDVGYLGDYLERLMRV